MNALLFLVDHTWALYLLDTVLFIATWALLSATAGYLFGRCDLKVSPDALTTYVIFSPVGFFVGLGYYFFSLGDHRRKRFDRARERVLQIEDAQHQVELAALCEKRDEIIRVHKEMSL